MRRRGFTLAELLVVILIIALLMALAGSSETTYYLTGPYHVVAGWLYYLTSTLPKVRITWSAIITFLVAAMALIFVSHSFFRWIAKQRGASMWRMASTIKVLAIVMLAFAAGICAVGVVHQIGWLASSKEPLREKSGFGVRVHNSFNLQELVKAMKEYENKNGTLPPVYSMSKETPARPFLSWRVLLLPYLNEQELFAKFKLDEPWDSSHNLKVLEEHPIPKVFVHPTRYGFDTKYTHYRAFYSNPGVKPAAGLTTGEPLTLNQIRAADGVENSAVLMEGDPVLWTKPEDIEFDATGPLPALKSLWKSDYLVIAVFDQKAENRSISKYIKLNAPAEAWKAMITRNGAEKVDWEQLESK